MIYNYVFSGVLQQRIFDNVRVRIFGVGLY